MGLTIHYSLKLPDPQADPRTLLEALRQRALDLPFETVSNIVEFEGDAADFNKLDPNDEAANEWRWLLIQSCHHQPVKLFQRYDKKWTEFHRMVTPQRVIAFEVWPGEGCESMNLGFCLYPESITMGGEAERYPMYFYKEKTVKLPQGWSWHSFCKTQYAAEEECGGSKNFLRCHLSAIRLLDHARKLKILKSVSDEGDFYRSRNIGTLLRNVDSSREMIAALGNLLSGAGWQVESPISNAPDLANLIEAGRAKNPNIDRLLKELGREKAAA